MKKKKNRIKCTSKFEDPDAAKFVFQSLMVDNAKALDAMSVSQESTTDASSIDGGNQRRRLDASMVTTTDGVNQKISLTFLNAKTAGVKDTTPSPPDTTEDTSNPNLKPSLQPEDTTENGKENGKDNKKNETGESGDKTANSDDVLLSSSGTQQKISMFLLYLSFFLYCISV